MATGYCSAPHSAADQVAQLLAELDVFDQETARLSREWEASAMLPRGSIAGGNSYWRTGFANEHVPSQPWDTWEHPRAKQDGATVGIDTLGASAVLPSAGRLEERNQRNWADRCVSWKAETVPRSGGLEGWEREWNNAAQELGEVSGEGLANQSEGESLVDNKLNLVADEDGLGNQSEREKVCGRGLDNGGVPQEDGRDGLEKGDAIVRPKKAAFTFSRTPRFPEVSTASTESAEAGGKIVLTEANPNPKQAQTLNPKLAPPFAKAPPRRTNIEELVTQSMPTTDMVYEPEYKLVHKRVPGTSFGKPVSGRGKKRRGCGTDSNDGVRQAAERSVLDSLCRKSGANVDCFGETRLVLSEEKSEGTNEIGEEKSTLGPGFYDVDLKPVQKRVPAVGFATMVSREEPGRARRTEEGQLLTLDLTRALGAVSKRVKGVVGFGSGPPRFVEEDDKENQTRIELEPNYRALEPRVKGALPYKKPAGADRPKPLSPENSQLLTSRSAASSLGTASPMDTPRGVLPSPDPTPLFPRHPAWKFSPPTNQGSPAKPQTRPLRQLTPNETLVRPRTEGALEFGRATGRVGKEESVTVRLRRAKQPGPGQYALAQAWRHLQRHVPSAAFGAMARRWADASLTSADGIRTALEELSAAVRLTRPRPPAWSFVPVSASLPVRRTWDGRRPLDVRISFVKRRTGLALGFDAQTGRRHADVTARDVDRRDYSVHFELVEAATRVADFGHGSERRLGGDVSEGDGYGMELDVDGGLEATRWRPPQMVPIDRQTGRPQSADGPNRRTRFLDPDADLPLKPHVPTVHMSAHPNRWIDDHGSSDGPDVGAYDMGRPIGLDATTVDFALAKGRELAKRVRKRLEGDRLLLDVDAGWDAVKPSAPSVIINPVPSEGLHRELPGPEVGYYEPNLTLTKRRPLDGVDMSRMQARNRITETGLPDGERLAAGLGEYPLSDEAVRATVRVPGFERYRGHVANGPRNAWDDQPELAVSDGLVRPHHWTLSDMDKMVGRREEQRERFTDLDYDTNNAAFRPAVPSVRLAAQTGHETVTQPTGAGDLDAGCYDVTRVGERRAPAVDFVSGPTRAILDPYEPSMEGDQLILAVHAAEPGDAARRRAAAAADFGRASDRWLPGEVALLDRAELGNNLLLRPELGPVRRRAPEVDFSRDRPRWEWADARADAIELYGEGHFMEHHLDDAPMRARTPGFDFGRVEGRSALEAREEKRVLRAMPRGQPIEQERLLEGLKLTRYNPPRTNFGQPPLPPIQESLGRGEAAERAFFNRLTKETRLNAMMDRLKGGADNLGKPKRKIRVSGAVAVDLEAVREGRGWGRKRNERGAGNLRSMVA